MQSSKKLWWKGFVVSGLLVALALRVEVVRAADKEFPNRQIEIVVPMVPGGMADLSARIIGSELSKQLGSPILIINTAGAGGVVAADRVAHAKPDGYTMLAGYPGLYSIIPAMQPNIPYKVSDFIPIARYANSPNLMLVRRESPWKTLEEFIRFAKANPGKLSCGSSGIGAVSHFNIELLKIEAGVDILHVPYKGGSQSNASILGGEVDCAFIAVPNILGLLKSGELRALASTAGKIADFPDIPTLAEKGYPGAELGLWTGLFLPKGTDKTVVEKVATMVEKSAKAPHVIKKLEEIGFQAEYIGGEDFVRSLDKEREKLAEVVRKANLGAK